MQKHLILIALLALTPLPAFTADPAEEASQRVRVWQHAQETGICELHGIAMTKKIVPIIYGIPTWEGANPTTRLKLFPHAQEKYFGGCLVLGGQNERTLHLLCVPTR
jgi:hypothetical protein